MVDDDPHALRQARNAPPTASSGHSRRRTAPGSFVPGELGGDARKPKYILGVRVLGYRMPEPDEP